jgi:hypothetical protein
MLVGLAACHTTPKQLLQGKWVGERVDNFHPEQQARALGWAGATSLEFRGSRVTVAIPAESPRHGTFRVAEDGPQELVVTFLRAHGDEDEVHFRVEGDDYLRWELGGGRSILLRRVND